VFELFIRCPATADAVSTGVRLNTANWNKTAAFWAYSRCAACGADHEWQAHDTTLLPVPPAMIARAA
jgi:hypothetical protein